MTFDLKRNEGHSEQFQGRDFTLYLEDYLMD